MTQICSNIRKPGGTIPNPNAAIAGQPPMIPDPGVQVGQIYERRLVEFRYYMSTCSIWKIQRLPIIPQDATLAQLTAIYRLKDQDEEDDDTKLPEPLSKIESARKSIEDLDNYLLQKRGSSGVPYISHKIQ
jgi:hypothetical protein